METLNLKEIDILVVDDYAPMRHIISGILRELGIRKIREAGNGEAALKMLGNDSDPDIVITDTIMEPVDGIEFTRQIRSGENGINPLMPVIMVSGKTDMQAIMEARDAGVTEFLAKPVSAKLLYYRVCSVINCPRTFVRAGEFFGPDRRRRQAPIDHEERRSNAYEYTAPARESEREPENGQDDDGEAAAETESESDE